MLTGLQAALGEGAIIVEATAQDRISVCEAAERHRPDAVVLSSRLPGGAIEAVEHIADHLPATEIVIIANDANDADVLRFVAAGVHGFLLGSTDPGRLPHAIRGVLAGEAAFPRRIVRLLADELARREKHRRTLAAHGVHLTAREAEVLDLLATGASTPDTAERLGISEATVRSHAARATRKVGAGGRADALRVITGGLAPSPGEETA